MRRRNHFPSHLRMLVPALLVLFSACLFENGEEKGSRPGYLRLDIELGARKVAALRKSAASDTTFQLDSLKIELSTPGLPSSTHAYAISGRADTGNIAVTSKFFPLAPLRTWKAKIWTLDTILNPPRVDTVHLDSISFEVSPGDTAAVGKTITPVFSILVARILSNDAASIANTVKFARIRVDGTTRDSIQLGPTLRSVEFGNGTNGVMVGDSGTMLRTTDGGVNWVPVASGTAQNLNGVNFPSANTGYAVGDAGTVLKTTNGTAWTAQSSGTTANLHGVHFTGNSAGCAVGSGGIILKSNGTTWTPATATGTANALYGVHFTGSSTGYAVGSAGTIVKTTNNGTNWSALSSGTTMALHGVHFPTAGTGYVVGELGTIRKTTNNGSSWAALSSGTTQKLTGVYFRSATLGWAVGEGGAILRTTNGSTWTLLASGTGEPFHGIAFTTNNARGTAIGRAGTLFTSTDGVSWAPRPVGTKVFDVRLAYKYLKPGLPHTLILEAMDTLALPLRGYQTTHAIDLSPGKDTTVAPGSGLAKCGYSGFPGCTP